MWPSPQETADLITFMEEILDGKLHFLDDISQIVRSKSSMIFKPLLHKVAKWSNAL